MLSNQARTSLGMRPDISCLLSAGAQTAVAALFQTIQARTSWHEPLLSLSGRLELVRAQLNRGAVTVETAEALKPMVGACRPYTLRGRLGISGQSASCRKGDDAMSQMEYFESDTDDISDNSGSDIFAEEDGSSDVEPRGSDSGNDGGGGLDEAMSE